MPSGRLCIVAALAFVVATTLARAASYPERPIKVIVPLTAGSPVDAIARVITPRVSARLGQPMPIENRAGGGGTIATKGVATSDPDGYTLLYTAVSHVIGPALTRKSDYDPVKDFVAVAGVGLSSWVLVVEPSLPVRTLREFIAHAKANPGKLNFGFGMATGPHLLGELFKSETGTHIASVSYRGGAQAITDMLGGRIHMNFGATATLLPLIRDGKLRALAVTGPTRSPDLPDVPTMIELGYPRLTLTFWTGFLAPAGTPAPVVQAINAAVNASLDSPEVKENFAQIGIQPIGGSPEAFGALIANDGAVWAGVARSAGITTD